MRMTGGSLTVCIRKDVVLGGVTHVITLKGDRAEQSFCFDNLSDALLRVATLLSPPEPEAPTGHPRASVKPKRKKFLLKQAILNLMSDGKPRDAVAIRALTKAPKFDRPEQTYGTVLANMVKFGSIEVSTTGLYKIAHK